MSKFSTEALKLLASPYLAIKDISIHCLGISAPVSKIEPNQKIIIDEDGNVTLNLQNPEVQKELERHIQILSGTETV